MVLHNALSRVYDVIDSLVAACEDPLELVLVEIKVFAFLDQLGGGYAVFPAA